MSDKKIQVIHPDLLHVTVYKYSIFKHLLLDVSFLLAFLIASLWFISETHYAMCSH